jgi:hypothetical protein
MVCAPGSSVANALFEDERRAWLAYREGERGWESTLRRRKAKGVEERKSEDIFVIVASGPLPFLCPYTNALINLVTHLNNPYQPIPGFELSMTISGREE